MGLTQQTHGRLLPALSFDNRYPSPTSTSPSISSVSRVFVLFARLFLPLLFFLPFFFFRPLSLPPSSVTHIRRTHLIFSLLQKLPFPLPLPSGFHTLIQSLSPPALSPPPPLFHLSIGCIRQSNPRRKERFCEALRLLPERQWPTQK